MQVLWKTSWDSRTGVTCFSAKAVLQTRSWGLPKLSGWDCMSMCVSEWEWACACVWVWMCECVCVLVGGNWHSTLAGAARFKELLVITNSVSSSEPTSWWGQGHYRQNKNKIQNRTWPGISNRGEFYWGVNWHTKTTHIWSIQFDRYVCTPKKHTIWFIQLHT